MEAVILLAGYGSRLGRQDIPHKALLPFGDETLLSRHLSCLEELGMDRVHLVLGHNKNPLMDYVRNLNLDLPVNFIDNELYLTTGNTLSMVMGLRQSSGDVLILDADVLYPRQILLDYVKESGSSSFALTPVDIDNEECAKVLLKSTGAIHAFITKRLFTEEEKNGYEFAGEAIGFFKLSESNAKKFISLYEKNESVYEKALWEIPFSDFAQGVNLSPWKTAEKGCFEIDTQDEYEQALDYFQSHRNVFG